MIYYLEGKEKDRFQLTASDWVNPNWNESNKVHNWRNYISEDMIKVWNTFTDIQKFYIFENAQTLADQEEWE